MLQRVLADYCAEHGVSDDEGRGAVADSLIVLFDSGLQTPQELPAALTGRRYKRTG